MKKMEVLNHIRSSKGFVPYIGIFEIFNDDDEIPQVIIDMYSIKERASGSFLICNSKVAEQIKKFQNK